MTRLVLIRHGEAQSALDRLVGGAKGCTGLSDLGRRQAAALRDRVERTGELSGAVALYASTLPRAIETAEALAPVLGGLTVAREHALREQHPGEEIDGLSWDEANALYPFPGADPYARWSPGTESWAEFTVRVGTELDRLTHEHPKGTVVVACHGGVIEAGLLAFADLPLRRQFRLQVDNTSITEWELRQYDEVERWTLVRFNDASHLAGLTG